MNVTKSRFSSEPNSVRKWSTLLKLERNVVTEELNGNCHNSILNLETDKSYCDDMYCIVWLKLFEQRLQKHSSRVFFVSGGRSVRRVNMNIRRKHEENKHGFAHSFSLYISLVNQASIFPGNIVLSGSQNYTVKARFIGRQSKQAWSLFYSYYTVQ